MKRWIAAAALALALTSVARAEIKVGIVVSATGPAASLGIPQQNAATLLPATIAGEPASYVLLDDGSDTTNAVRNVRKLLTDNKVDVILGPSITPNALAATSVMAEAGVPMITMASSGAITEPPEGAKRWVFKVPQGDSVQAEATILDMRKRGVTTLGFIAFADSYGDSYAREVRKATAQHGIKIVSDERFARSDLSVTAQVLRLVGSKPDAVFIVGAGTPAALPQLSLAERGYKGLVYQTNGVTSQDFIRVGGKAVEGTIIAVTPMLVAEQLPDSHPSKSEATAFLRAYEGKFGLNTRSNFAALMWDAEKLLEAAVPAGLKAGRPGTPEFRTGLREGLEQIRGLSLNTGTFTYSATDHSGLDASAMVFVRIENGSWKLAQ